MKLFNVSRLGSSLSLAIVLVGSLLGSVKAQACIPDRTALLAARDDYLASSTPDTYSHATYGPIKDWCFDPALTDFSTLFKDKNSLPAGMDLSNWNVEGAGNMNNMFTSSNFNGDISSWNVGKVTTMFYMFQDSPFNGDISNWNVGKVTGFASMFYNADNFDQDIGGWDVSSGEAFVTMFANTNTFNQDLSCWNVGAGTNFNNMFSGASAFKQDLCPWGADVVGTPSTSSMFANSGCFVTTDPVLADEPMGDFCYQCTANPPNACTWVQPACSNGGDWCLEFGSFASSLDGDAATSDITLTYTASEPAKDAATGEDTKFYKISLLDSATCLTPIPDTAGVTAIYEEVKADTAEGFKNWRLIFGLDIDTTKIETYDGNGVAFQLDPPVANQFQAKFCAKVDLYSKVGAEVYKVETSETVLTLRFDKTKNFEFSITAEKEGRGSRATDVQINHELDACVCALGNDAPANPSTCLSDYTLNPGDYFKFCVKDKNPGGEATLDSVKGVAFKNTQDSEVNIPILGSTGAGVGPSSVACNNGECVVTARTYARMYEKVETDGSVTDISTGSKIDGTAVLRFARRRLVRGSIVQETESVEVNFGGRALQEDGTTPVNDFEVDMNLATPPDRSSATASSAMAFASLMMAGLVGVVML